MKQSFWLLISIIILNSCGNHETELAPIPPPQPAVKEKPIFFPVTAFILGQLADLRERGINPLKYTTVNNMTDSVWLKIDEVPAAVNEFVQPVIDTTNLVQFFTESKFQDRGLDSYTLTYQASGTLPDSMQLRRWDVYADVITGKVKKIYIVKRTGPDKELQLTWQADKWCTIITITNPDGDAKVVKEEKITWDF